MPNNKYLFLTDSLVEKECIENQKPVTVLAKELAAKHSTDQRPISVQTLHGCITHRLNKLGSSKKDQVPRLRRKNKRQKTTNS